MTSTNGNDGELDPQLVDMLDEHFPKGQCQERGQAMVLLADFLRWHQSLLERREIRARIDELELIDERGGATLRLAELKAELSRREGIEG